MKQPLLHLTTTSLFFALFSLLTLSPATNCKPLLAAEDKRDASASESADRTRSLRTLPNQIHQKLRELQQLREEHRLLRAKQAEARSRDIQLNQSLNAELTRLTNSLSDKTKYRQQLKQSLLSRQSQMSADAEAFNMWTQQILKRAQTFVQLIGAGLPIKRRQRLQPFNEIVAALSDDSSRNEKQKAISLYFEKAGDELAWARQVELINTRIELIPGERIEHVWLLRLGNVAAVFMSENESVIGHWHQQQWQTQLDATTKANIKRIIEICQAKRLPVISPFPLPLTTDGKGGDK